MTTFVQLGWISDAINYVFDKLINPFISLVSEFLSNAFKWLFNTLLEPLLETAFSLISQTIIRYGMRVIGRVFYRIEIGFLQILEVFEDVFRVLAGITKVSDSEMGVSGSLLSVIAQSGYVRNAMWASVAIAFVLCFFFTILGTIKSISDMGGPQSKSVGHVLRQLMYAMIRMFTAPVIGLFLIVLGDAVLLAVTNAMTFGEGATIARTLFVISSLDAVDDEFGAIDRYGVNHKGGLRFELSFKDYSARIGDFDNMILGYNSSTRQDYLEAHPGAAKGYGLNDIFRQPFYAGTKDYTRAFDVDDTFNMGRLNFLVGIGGALLFIFILGSSLFVLTGRIFDIVVLLIVEPFFVAAMPLDDGEHFQKWEELFLGKIFSGYGMIVAMYLYLLVCTLVFEGKIAFTAMGDFGDVLTDMLMSILILVGGAATVMTAGPLVTSIISSVAAGQEAGQVAVGQKFSSAVMDTASAPVKFAGKLGTDALINKISGGRISGIFYPSDNKDGEGGEGSSGGGGFSLDSLSNMFSGKKNGGGGMNLPSPGSWGGGGGSSMPGMPGGGGSMPGGGSGYSMPGGGYYNNGPGNAYGNQFRQQAPRTGGAGQAPVAPAQVPEREEINFDTYGSGFNNDSGEDNLMQDVGYDDLHLDREDIVLDNDDYDDGIGGNLMEDVSLDDFDPESGELKPPPFGGFFRDNDDD